MKQLSRIISIALSVFILMSTQAMAWTSSSSTYGVTVSKNGNNQTVHRVFINGTLILEIFTKGSNIWNNTSQVLFKQDNINIDNNSSQNVIGSNAGIDSSLRTYGIGTNGIAVRYEASSDGYSGKEELTEYPGAYAFQKDANGFVTGIYTSSGLYDIATDRIVNSTTNSGYITNTSSYSSYPYIDQSGNTYYYHPAYNVSPFQYTFSNNKLKYNNTEIKFNNSNTRIEEIAWANGYVLCVDSNNTVHRVAIGSTYAEVVCYNFREWQYDTTNPTLVVAVVDLSYNVYQITSNYNYNYNYNYTYSNNYGYTNDYGYGYNSNTWYYGDYQIYPRVNCSGNTYNYYESTYSTYTYQWAGDGYKISLVDYNGNTSTMQNGKNVEEIGFANGYLIYIVNETAYIAEIGETTYSSKKSNFEGFIYDDDYDENGLVIGIVYNSGKTFYF